MSIAENIKRVDKNIEDALMRSGRKPGETKLIAVSKTKPVEDMLSAYSEGVRDFGENYVQEIVQKYDNIPSDARLHMIGHLQTNKVKKVVGRVAMIHSVDSLHLAEAISRESVKLGITTDVLLEVNIADEATKYGFTRAEAMAVVPEIMELSGVALRGLMTSAPITEDPETNRTYFKAMRELLSEMRELMRQRGTAEEKLPTELSMGMTGDYIVAVEEGATMVRVGTAIFGARDYSSRA